MYFLRNSYLIDTAQCAEQLAYRGFFAIPLFQPIFITLQKRHVNVSERDVEADRSEISQRLERVFVYFCIA